MTNYRKVAIFPHTRTIRSVSEQLKKASSAALQERGIVTNVSASHPSKARLPTDFTEDGIVTDVSDLLPLNAPSAIDSTDGGMMRDVSDSHQSKA